MSELIGDIVEIEALFGDLEVLEGSVILVPVIELQGDLSPLGLSSELEAVVQVQGMLEVI